MKPNRWAQVAFAALGASALYAVVLVLLRSPLALDMLHADALFRRVLVSHVQLAAVVWLLAAAAARWSQAGPGGGRLAGPAAVGVVLLAGAPFAADAPVLLVNYLPAIDHVLFWTGGALFAGAVAAAALGFLLAGTRMRSGVDPTGWLTVSALAVLIAGAALVRDAGGEWGRASWSAGHWLLFAFLALGVDAWHALLGRPQLPRLRAAALAYGVVILAGALWLAGHDEPSPALHTRLMQWGLWPLPLLAAGMLLREWVSRGAPMSAGAAVVLASLLLFLVGCALGALIRGDGLMVPAHYHATLGALTAALLAAYLLPADVPRVLPRAGLLPALLAYLSGKLMLAAGLAALGLAGGARKTPWLGLHEPGWLAVTGTAAMVVGGALAVGGILWIMGVRMAKCRQWKPMEEVAKVQVRHG